MMLVRYLRADRKKLRHMAIGAAHLIMPVGAAVIFWLCYRYVPGERTQNLEAYYQVLGMGFPCLIGVFSALLAEQELSAGAFWNMLSAVERVPAFFSKLLLLVLYGAGAVLLASLPCGMGIYLLEGGNASFGFAAALLLLGSNLFCYVLHVILAFTMHEGVTVGVGMVESLLAALLLTGMGEGVWPLVPAAWGSRFVTLLLRASGSCAIIDTECRIAVLVCIGATLGSLVVFYLWACCWEGKRGTE